MSPATSCETEACEAEAKDRQGPWFGHRLLLELEFDTSDKHVDSVGLELCSPNVGNHPRQRRRLVSEEFRYGIIGVEHEHLRCIVEPQRHELIVFTGIGEYDAYKIDRCVEVYKNVG